MRHKVTEKRSEKKITGYMDSIVDQEARLISMQNLNEGDEFE